MPPPQQASDNANALAVELWRWMYHLHSLRRDEFNAHYHRRSNVESVFSMMKRKFGEKLRSRGEIAQINEALCKVLCHNICCLIQSMHELNLKPKFYQVA